MAFNTEWRVVENYNNTGRRYFVVPMMEMAFEITDDGIGTGFFLAAAAPQGGLPTGLGRYPALAKGEPGFAPSLVPMGITELDSDDPTPASFDIQPIADATEVSGPVYGVTLALHKGKDGADGAALITPSDYGTPVFGQALTVAAGEASFELTYPKVGGQHLPASISSAPAGSTAEFTMAQIDVTAGTYNFDWTPSLRGNAITVGAGGTGGTGTDLQVDLIVRLNDETGGNIIGRGRGVSGVKTYQPNIISKVETGTNVIAAGDAATLYFRTKKITGSATYSAASTDAAFEMIAVPVP